MCLVPSGQDVVQVLGSDNFKSERDLKTGGRHGDGQQEQCQFSQLNQSSPFQHPAPTLLSGSGQHQGCSLHTAAALPTRRGSSGSLIAAAHGPTSLLQHRTLAFASDITGRTQWCRHRDHSCVRE